MRKIAKKVSSDPGVMGIIFLGCFVTLFGAGMLLSRHLPDTYYSEAKIALYDRQNAREPIPRTMIDQELRWLQSTQFLVQVGKELSLTEIWSKRFRVSLTSQDMVLNLEKMVRVVFSDKTMFLQVGAFGEKQESAQIANTMAQIYLSRSRNGGDFPRAELVESASLSPQPMRSGKETAFYFALSWSVIFVVTIVACAWLGLRVFSGPALKPRLPKAPARTAPSFKWDKG